MMKKLLLLFFMTFMILGNAGMLWADPYADAWISFTPGPYTIGDYADPENALGAPDDPGVTTINYTSLGWGGILVLEFTDNSLTTSGNTDNDLWIYEIGAAVEPTNVYISKNGADWISVGAVGGSTAGIDIDSFIGSGVTAWEQYSYVKLTDQYLQLSGSPYAGADITSVEALSSAPPVSTPEPATMLLLGLGLMGLAGARRKLS